MSSRALVLACAAVTLLGVMLAGAVAQDDDAADKKAEVTLINAKENLLSQEIWGKWTLHEEITNFIAEGERTELMNFTVSKDDAAKERITKAIAKFIDSGKERKHDGITRAVIEAARTVYCAGKLSGEKDGKLMELDFALTSAHGVPLLILIFNDHLEASYVSFVRDPDGDNDLLFVGGDRPTEHFRCFKRAAEEEEQKEGK
jgi:hypothetical protein